MNALTSKFYIGNINKFGFGTWNSCNPEYLRPRNTFANSITNTNTITTQPNKQFITSYKALPKLNSASYLHETQQREKEYASNRARMQLLEDKIQKMKEQIDENNKNNNINVYRSSHIPYTQSNTTPYITSHPNQNNMMLPFSMPVLPPINLPLPEPYIRDRHEKRAQIKEEIRKARMKLNENVSEDTDETEEDEEKEEEEEEEEEEKQQPQQQQPVMQRPLHLKQVVNLCKCDKKALAQDEADDFIKLIPNHQAFKIQKHNFQVRNNLDTIQQNFEQIRPDLDAKLRQLEMRQKMNFHNMRYVIERGGTSKLHAGIRKFIDGDNIDLDKIQEEQEEPAILRKLPYVVEAKLQENERRRQKEDEIRKKEFDELKKAETQDIKEENYDVKTEDNILLGECKDKKVYGDTIYNERKNVRYHTLNRNNNSPHANYREFCIREGIEIPTETHEVSELDLDGDENKVRYGGRIKRKETVKEKDNNDDEKKEDIKEEKERTKKERKGNKKKGKNKRKGDNNDEEEVKMNKDENERNGSKKKKKKGKSLSAKKSSQKKKQK